ncbi:MAG TPA: hypothetical protein VK453_05180 [Micromonosporaceae bacterium]|nr:hypothetical protein [Micromonosporaceae bacterium]
MSDPTTGNADIPATSDADIDEAGAGSIDVPPPADAEADAEAEAEIRRNGGPTLTGGLLTTTGGSAGPASFPRRTSNADSGEKVAPTTTGDATSGGMSTPAGGSTSDATTGGAVVGDFTDR